MTIPDDRRWLWSRPHDRAPDGLRTDDPADGPQPEPREGAELGELELWILKDLFHGTRPYRPKAERHLARLERMGYVKLHPKKEDMVIAWLSSAGLEYLRRMDSERG